MMLEEEETLGVGWLSLSDPIPCSEGVRKLPSARPSLYVKTNLPDTHRNAYDRMITIRVDSDAAAEHFQVHRGLLCHFSNFFNDLLNGPLEHAETHVLSTCQVQTFQSFRNWMYRGDVLDEDEAITATEIVDIYVFAHQYMVPELRDRALELYLFHFLKEGIAPQGCTRIIYEKTSEQSCLRKIHVQMLVDTYDLENLRDWMCHDPKEFLGDIIEHCRDNQIVPGSAPGLKNADPAVWVENIKAAFCDEFHEHPKPDGPRFIPQPVEEVLTATRESEMSPRTVRYKHEDQSHVAPAVSKPFQMSHAKPTRRDHSNVKCWNCHERGHSFWKCPEPRDWSRVKCMACRERGHTTKRCPYQGPEPEDEDEDVFDGEVPSSGFGSNGGSENSDVTRSNNASAPWR